MRKSFFVIAASSTLLGAMLSAAPAFAGEASGVEARLARVEQQLAQQAAPSPRETQSAVDAYLAAARSDSSLVGGPGSAGYDGGFWIRGGSFLLKINLTIQARYEYFDWDDSAAEPVPGGDLSGFSLPRVTLKLSGDATCDIHYYAEFEFGHHGSLFSPFTNLAISTQFNTGGSEGVGSRDTIIDAGDVREAWIEYEPCPQFVWRMGLIKTAATRQLMTAPEHQQFVDVSGASTYIGGWESGYTDRNRDYGVMIHGVLGCDGEWSYMLTATNGDGPITRNIWDVRTDDNLAYSARLNWDFAGHMGYEEGALRNNECQWTGAIGAWVYLYNARSDKTHTKLGDFTAYGADLALGYGSWSFTGAYSVGQQRDHAFNSDEDGTAWFAQLGYLFCGTAWEIAARYGSYSHEFLGGPTFGATEWGVAINYYIDGHADKLTADVSMITPDDDGQNFAGLYPGYHVQGQSDAMLVRFQWQLAL